MAEAADTQAPPTADCVARQLDIDVRPQPSLIEKRSSPAAATPMRHAGTDVEFYADVRCPVRASGRFSPPPRVVDGQPRAGADFDVDVEAVAAVIAACSN